MRPRGLTLIDLLVIVLLIALVCALILPALGAARESARRAQCAKNLSSISKCMFMYADVPSNGVFPTKGPLADRFADPAPMAAFGLLYNKYVADTRVFSCPSNPVDPKILAALKPGGPIASSYAYDPGHGPADNPGTVILGDMKGAQQNSNNHGNNAGQNIVIVGGSDAWSYTPEQPSPNGKQDNIFKLDPEIPRYQDAFIRQ